MPSSKAANRFFPLPNAHTCCVLRHVCGSGTQKISYLASYILCSHGLSWLVWLGARRGYVTPRTLFFFSHCPPLLASLTDIVSFCLPSPDIVLLYLYSLVVPATRTLRAAKREQNRTIFPPAAGSEDRARAMSSLGTNTQAGCEVVHSARA
jgi:hypothetical protein